MPTYTTIASTNFPQADGPINPAQWTTDDALATFTVVGHIVQTTSTAVCSSHWSGNPFPLAGNQWSEAAIHNCTGSVDNIILVYILVPDVTTQSGGFFVQGQPDGTGNIVISLSDNTSGTFIGSTFTIPFVADAILRIEFINGVATVKYNGVTLESLSGLSSHNLDSGPAGMGGGQDDLIANLTISHFAAGTIIPDAGGSGASFTQRQHNFANKR
jgi:hypothetical protein